MATRHGPSASFLEEDVKTTLVDASGVPISSSNPLPTSTSVDIGLVTDAFKNLLVGSRYNTVEVHLDDVNWTNYVTTTLTSGGTVPQSAGSVIFTSGTNTNGRSRAVSLDNVVYRPMHEAYAAWTAAWLDGGLTNSYQRIGWGDTAFVNGVFTTHEGVDFGLLYINNSSSLFVPQADWDDPCLGQVGSGYTLNGSPVAMDTTKKQVFMATAGLLGSLTLDVWAWSPDQEPVRLHTFSRPNVSAQAIFSNFDLPILCDILKTGAGATSLRLSSACWAGGSTLDKIRISDPFTDRTLVTPVAALIRGRSTAGGTSYVDVKVNPSGTLPTANTSVGPTGAAVPAEATYLGVNDGGGNLVPLVQPATDAELRATPLPVTDVFPGGQVLADQPGAGGVLTFTFSAAVQLAVVFAKSAAGTLEARADPFGGTPSATAGIPCDDGVPNTIPVTTSSVKVFAPVGMTVSVWGFRY